MNVKKKLRNSLIGKIQNLSTGKLTELNSLLNNIENKSKTNTLKLAGSWRNLEEGFFNDYVEKLHENRIKDRDFNKK